MRYKIYNPYRESSILALNMMGVHEYRRIRFSLTEALLTAVPLVLIVALFAGSMMPELTFFADCKNVANGDVCSIRLG